MQGSSRRYLLTSAVYAGPFILLVCLAVFAGSFTRTVGDARVSGRFSPLPLFNRSRLEALTLSWNGLDLQFSRASQPGLLRFESAEEGADIVLDGNERLHVSLPDERRSGLTISPVADAGSPTTGLLMIPFKVSGLLLGESDSTLSWRQGERSFQLSLPAGARIDYAAREITMSLAQAALPELRFVSLSPEKAVGVSLVQTARPAAAPRLPDEKSLATQDQLAASLAHYADLAYAGWTLSRFSQGDGTWRMADGKQGFSENIGIGLLAESVARGTLADSLQMWTHALDAQLNQNPDLPLSYSTCVYTGRVRDFARQSRARDATEYARIKTLAGSGDASLLSQPGFLLMLLDRGGPALAKTTLTALRAQDVGRLAIPAALTLLEAMEDDVQFIGDDPTVPASAQQLIDTRLIPSLAATSDGAVFLAASGGSVDVALSIRCGALLLRAGSVLKAQRASAFGRSLIVSSLALASDNGFLPTTLSLASGKIASKTGAIAPESIYEMLPQDKHIPHEVPLYRQMGQGCWVWTASDLLSAQTVDGEVQLVFAYPGGVAQHLVFRGVRPFSQIRLHGIPWHSDPSYANYSDGWAYDEANRTLTMKITGRHETEEVDLTF